MTLRRAVAIAVLAACTHAASAGPIVYSAAGTSAGDIAAAVNAFRSALGTLNPNVAGSFAGGRREINWDGVPGAFAAPNNLPANFFNVNSPRGVIFATPGTGFQVSASVDGFVPIQFGNIDPAYPSFFEPFSPQRLFTSLGSNITDVNFLVPGSSTPAFTSAFGVVFSDVDLAVSTSLEFFDLTGASLGTFLAPAIVNQETFSFLGVQFTAEQVGRVRVTSGTSLLAAGNSRDDLVAMDDFIYAEPRAVQTVSLPGTLTLLAIGLLAFTCRPARRLVRGVSE